MSSPAASHLISVLSVTMPLIELPSVSVIVSVLPSNDAIVPAFSSSPEVEVLPPPVWVPDRWWRRR